MTPTTELVLTFLAASLLLFAALVAAAFLVVRAVFIRVAERLGREPGTDADRRAFLARLERLERVMDRQIRLPLVGGIGLDAVVGLVPYVGDTVSALVTASLITRSLQLGLPRELVARMVANMFVDLLFGAIPIVGDVFDIAFKANTRNIALVRAHLAKEAGVVTGAGRDR